MKRVMVTGGTKCDVAPIAVFAINLKKTNGEFFDELIIFHDGISIKDQSIISNIFPTRFIKYQYPNRSKNDEVLTYFSPMIFCKYECFKLLNDYDVVVWSDYDVVILDSLKEFCTMNDEVFHVLTCRDDIRSMFYKDIRSQEILNYELDREGVGTPLFALSNRLIGFNEIYEWCYEKTAKWDESLYLPEQCIFGLLVQHFDISVKRFPFDKYACYPTKTVGDEIIIHAAGQPKFWNGLKCDLWDDMYKEWISMGGSQYSDRRKKIKHFWLLVKTRICGIREKEHI